MKVVLVSRYPRVDTPAWKRHVAERLLAAGCELAVLYSRSGLVDQARAGLAEEGLGIFRRYLTLRGGSDDTQSVQSLADWAREHDLPVVLARRLGDESALEALRGLQPDLLVLVGSDIVPRPVLEIPRLGTINPHYGLLPAYRGMNVTEWSLYAGDPIGVTVHMVDPGIDTGDILLREEIPVERGDTLPTLRAKHQEVAARLLVDAALALKDGTAERIPQRMEDGRQYYRMHPALRQVVERRLSTTARGPQDR
jgi:methionyl-tRNA formyltransferase